MLIHILFFTALEANVASTHENGFVNIGVQSIGWSDNIPQVRGVAAKARKNCQLH
jgi:hypothetical protein